ncbi:hypothetical protein N7541_010186 [Penicillium brevicompactum]|uniref:Uncharacterized protein n=1 Tax=Penicillium brevicompactum TaxID=5074 RepID=A0A9W9UHD6_PENBR|nr:hypothetical protein N7541_010186 [Penicillium brevicompactum]
MRASIYLPAILLAPLSVLAGPTSGSNFNTNIVRRGPAMKPLVGRSSPVHILVRSPLPADNKDEVCSSDEKRCGDACVPEAYTCCPKDVSGGCPKDEECQKHDGKYGCCPDGESCHWDNDDDDDDDDGNVFSRIGDFGDDVKDGWDDLWDNAGPSLKPELLTILFLGGAAAAAMGL